MGRKNKYNRISSYTGVYPYNKYKWAACLTFYPKNPGPGGSVIRLGIYDTETAAALRWLEAYVKLTAEQKQYVSNKK